MVNMGFGEKADFKSRTHLLETAADCADLPIIRDGDSVTVKVLKPGESVKGTYVTVFDVDVEDKDEMYFMLTRLFVRIEGGIPIKIEFKDDDCDCDGDCDCGSDGNDLKIEDINFDDIKWLSYELDNKNGEKIKILVGNAIHPEDESITATLSIMHQLDDPTGELFILKNHGWQEFGTVTFGDDDTILPENEPLLPFSMMLDNEMDSDMFLVEDMYSMDDMLISYSESEASAGSNSVNAQYKIGNPIVTNDMGLIDNAVSAIKVHAVSYFNEDHFTDMTDYDFKDLEEGIKIGLLFNMFSFASRKPIKENSASNLMMSTGWVLADVHFISTLNANFANPISFSDSDANTFYNDFLLGKGVFAGKSSTPENAVENLFEPFLTMYPSNNDAIERANAMLRTSILLYEEDFHAYCRNVDYFMLPPNGKFIYQDDAAFDWAREYNQSSIEEKMEFGSVIYKVTVYETAEKIKIAEEYYTYSHPIKGTYISIRNNFRASIKASNVPKPKEKWIEHKEVAQIHSHGPYVYVRYLRNGEDIILREERGFSTGKDGDIPVAEGRKVDTYMVDCRGDMYKATYANGYYEDAWYKNDKGSYEIEKVYISGFYVDPRISELKGEPLDLRFNPELW